MKRCLPLVLIFLVSCGQTGVLLWVSPTPNTTVGGSVVLQVDTPGGEVDNVVFSANGEFIAKSYDLSAVWDTSDLPSGVYTLEAKPFGLPPTSYARVRVSNVSTGEPAARKGATRWAWGRFLRWTPRPFWRLLVPYRPALTCEKFLRSLTRFASSRRSSQTFCRGASTPMTSS